MEDAIIRDVKKNVLKLMNLDKYKLQSLLETIRNKTGAVNKELSNIDINTIELNDLSDYEYKLKNTVTLAEDLNSCFNLLTVILDRYNGSIKKEHATIEEIISGICDINEEMDEMDFKTLTEAFNGSEPFISCFYLKDE